LKTAFYIDWTASVGAIQVKREPTEKGPQARFCSFHHRFRSIKTGNTLCNRVLKYELSQELAVATTDIEAACERALSAVYP
jgi:hypothetical protein